MNTSTESNRRASKDINIMDTDGGDDEEQLLFAQALWKLFSYRKRTCENAQFYQQKMWI